MREGKKSNGQPAKHRYHTWSDELYVECFILAQQGYTDYRIAQAIGVKHLTFDNWKWKRPFLRKALRRARAISGANDNFLEFVYKRMSPGARKIFEEIQEAGHGRKGFYNAKMLFERHGKRMRQHIFLHALIKANFNISQACRFCCISLDTFKQWKDEPRFMQLMEQVQEYKRDFFESALLNLVGRGDSSAVMFAMKTQCRDRGYGERMDVVHSGTVEHRHVVSVDQLQLSTACRAEILKSMRALQAAQNAAPKGLPAPRDPNEVDGEFSKVQPEKEVAA